uniref:ORF121 n=1 Tax=Cydia pomonella granulosis virus TaxID=28289 RepID=A0A6B9I625_GVCP|nr:ORF121 [Cydia pomonella granulovirus]QGZ00096.1 ORF121 [Cydia pomonella granulovirus]
MESQKKSQTKKSCAVKKTKNHHLTRQSPYTIVPLRLIIENTVKKSFSQDSSIWYTTKSGAAWHNRHENKTW